MSDRTEALERLEALVDEYGFYGVLELLATVCGEKEDHVLSAWQDKELAKSWRSAGRAVSVLSTKLDV